MNSYYRLVPVAILAAWVAMQNAWPGGLYRWVDENGEVHYSDSPPPPNVKSQKELKTPARPATPGTKAAPESYQQEDAAFRKRQVEQAEKDAAAKKAQQEAAEKQRNCEQAQNQLKALQAGGRFVRYNDQGERQYLDDKQVADEIARTQKLVSDWCN